jgi:hypothetical protein
MTKRRATMLAIGLGRGRWGSSSAFGSPPGSHVAEQTDMHSSRHFPRIAHHLDNVGEG